MQFGNLSGLVNGTDKVVFDYEVTGAAVSSISTGNILNGDEDSWYTVIARHVYDTATSTLSATFNADTTAANYGYLGITGNNTTVANINSTSQIIRLCSVASGTTTGFSIFRFHAKSGSVRTGNIFNSCDLTGTTVTQVEIIGSVWNDTSSNITGMTFTANKIGVGSRIIIIKTNNFTGGTQTGAITTPYIQGSWVRVGSSILGSNAQTVTFSGLNGDRDIIYYWSMSQKNGASAYSTPYLRINNDATSGNYGHQYLYGLNTSASSARSATTTGCRIGLGTYNLIYSWGYGILFAKTGFLRPMISQFSCQDNGVTTYDITSAGHSYTDTSTNITSLVFYSNAANGWGTGTQIDLYALRPNG